MTPSPQLAADRAGIRAWNGTFVRSRFFDALSLLLPAGEQFLIDTLQSWRAASEPPADSELSREVDRFIREEQAHRRAHANYNAALVAALPSVRAVAERAGRITDDLTGFGMPMKLALVAAFEHLTAVLAQEIEAHRFFIAEENTRAGWLWKWHAREELGHRHVAVLVARHAGLGRGVLTLALLLATGYLTGDLLRYTFALCRCDVRAGTRQWALLADTARFAFGAIPSLMRMTRHWFALLLSPSRCTH